MGGKFVTALVAAISILVAVNAQAATKCYEPGILGEFDKVWQDDEVRAWFQANHALARWIANTTCDQVEMFGRVKPEVEQLFQAKLVGHKVPEQLEEAAQVLKLDDWRYWQGFAAVYREHAQWIPPPRSERHDTARRSP